MPSWMHLHFISLFLIYNVKQEIPANSYSFKNDSFLRSHLQLYSIYVCIKIFYLFLMWTPQIYNSLDFSITNHMIDFICRTFAFCKSQGNVDFDCLCKKSTSLLILVESETKPELIYFREQWRRIIYKGIRIDPNV